MSTSSTLKRGLRALLLNPRLLLTITMVLVVPFLLLQLFAVFMSVAQSHVTQTARERIGTVHDALGTSMVTGVSSTTLQTYIKTIATKNKDLETMVVGEKTAAGVLIVAASDAAKVGTAEPEDEHFTRALIAPGTPIVYEYQNGTVRTWETVSIYTLGSKSWYVLTTQSHYVIDQQLAAQEWYAYLILLIAVLICVAAGYWQIRNLDFEVRYKEVKARVEEQNQITNMIAHELRSPLTAMRGYASMIREGREVPEPARGQASRIEESTERLVHIVNDFLDMARIQSGQLAVKPSDLFVEEVIQKVLLDLTPLATAKGLTLQTDSKTKTTGKLDRTRLEQILTNLITNAIKYTESGRVTVEVQTSGRELELRIKDTGSGISAENQQKLFTPFFRVEESAAKGIVGTGLGMWITKRLIEAQGGTIGVESIKNVGTNMVVRFKIKNK